MGEGSGAPIVVLNGVPRSGKSTLAAAMIRREPGRWTALGVDRAMAATPPDLQPGIGLRPGGERPDLEAHLPALWDALWDEVLAGHAEGRAMVVDVGLHDAHSRPLGIVTAAARRLATHPAWLVGVRCAPAEVLRRRAATGYPTDPELVARWEAAVHDPGTYDVEVDTSSLAPDDAADEVLALVDSPAAPTRWPVSRRTSRGYREGVTDTETLDSAEARRRAEHEAQLDGYRRELTGYCYRMLGSSFDAEDAAQTAMIRAWKALDGFDGRSSLRTWLYRITHNVCLDMLRGKQRRALPMDMGPMSTADVVLGEPLAGETWVEPVASGRIVDGHADPAEQAVQRESIRLAFVAALQELPPKQRAVLILREVLRWPAADVAALLDTTVAGVNSALQRARATLDGDDRPTPTDVDDEVERDLLGRYVEAFEAFDLDALIALLHEDATHSMPPWPLWLQGPVEWRRWLEGPGAECEGSRLVPIDVNGRPGFAQYRPSGPGGRHEPWCIQVPEIEGGRITSLTYFVDADLFPAFDLPPQLD